MKSSQMINPVTGRSVLKDKTPYNGAFAATTNGVFPGLKKKFNDESPNVRRSALNDGLLKLKNEKSEEKKADSIAQSGVQAFIANA